MTEQHKKSKCFYNPKLLVDHTEMIQNDSSNEKKQ